MTTGAFCRTDRGAPGAPPTARSGPWLRHDTAAARAATTLRRMDARGPEWAMLLAAAGIDAAELRLCAAPAGAVALVYVTTDGRTAATLARTLTEAFRWSPAGARPVAFADIVPTPVVVRPPVVSARRRALRAADAVIDADARARAALGEVLPW